MAINHGTYDPPLNAVVSYSGGANGIGGGLTIDGNYWDGYRCYPSWPWDVRPYTTIVNTVAAPSKFEQAFKVVTKLMELKLLDDMTVKKFIETVNAVAEAL